MRIAEGRGYASGSNSGSGSGAAPENQLLGCGGGSPAAIIMAASAPET